MLTIHAHQMEAFRAARQTAFEAAILEHVARFFPNDLALLGLDRMCAVIRDATARAERFGLKTQGEVRRYIDIALTLGAEWAADPLHPFAASVAAEGLEPGPAFQRLYEEAIDHVRFVSGDEGQYAMRALLKTRALAFEDTCCPDADGAEATLTRLRSLWPRKLRLLPARSQARFLALAEERARAAGFVDPGPRHLYTVLMFVAGAGFARDPALPWASAALTAPGDPVRALHDAGMRAIDDFLGLLPSRTEA